MRAKVREACKAAVRSLLNQGVFAVDNHGDCMYVNSAGKSCIVGILLRDSHGYSRPKLATLVGGAKGVLSTERGFCSLDLEPPEIEVLEAMQIVHDNAAAAWKRQQSPTLIQAEMRQLLQDTMAITYSGGKGRFHSPQAHEAAEAIYKEVIAEVQT